MTIRVGVVGCGRVAVHHLTHIRAIKGARLVGVADTDQDRARAIAGDAPVYESLEALIGAGKPDIVHITTPPATHEALAKKAFAKGVHAFVEKPLGMTAAEVERMYAAAKKAGRILCPDFINLYHPLGRRMLDLAASGKLGEIYRVEVRFSLDTPSTGVADAPPGHWMFGLPGGVLHNYTCHPLYMVLALTGPAKDVEVTHRATGRLGEGVTDQLEALIEGERAMGCFTLALMGEQPIYTWRVDGSRGSALVDFTGQTLTVQARGGLPAAVERLTGSLSTGWQLIGGVFDLVFKVLTGKLKPYPGLGALLPRLYAAVQSGGEPPVPAGLAIETARVSDAIFAKAGKLHAQAPAKPRAGKAKVGKAGGETVLLTGASGYLGRETARALVAARYRVRALVRPHSRFRALVETGCEVRFGDVRDAVAVRSAALGCDHIVHAAAALSGDRLAMIASAVDGTRNIAEAAKASGAKRVIYIGSVAAYDVTATPRGGSVDANSPLEADPAERGGSSEAKRLAEDVALEETRRPGSNWTILRPGLIFGCGRDPLKLMGPIVGGSTLFYGTGGSPTRFVHCADVAAAIVTALKSKATPGQIYTLAHTDRLTAREALKAMAPERGILGLPFWVMAMVAGTANILFKLMGANRTLGRKRVAYGYWNVWLDGQGFAHATGWKPAAPLAEQLATAAVREVASPPTGEALVATAWSRARDLRPQSE